VATSAPPVAVSNEGGSGSAVGDTTTTMMWFEPAARWLTQGRHVTVAYIAGFFVLLALHGREPVEHAGPQLTQTAIAAPR